MSNGYLPRLAYSDEIGKTVSLSFGGYRHTPDCSDSQIYHSVNMSADALPLLSTREKRSRVLTSSDVRSIFAYGSLYYISPSGTLYRFSEDGEDIAEVRGVKITSEPSDTYCAVLGDKLVFAPDMMYIDDGGSCASMTVRVGCEENMSFEIVSYGFRDMISEPFSSATLSRIKSYDIIRYKKTSYFNCFAVGDGVTLKGAVNPTYNKTLVIRSSFNSDGYSYLCFDRDSLSMNGFETFEIVREVPSLDFIFECGNRLWGCRGDRVYASREGDPFNWNVFEGGATDSFAATAGSAGEFTAACNYLGYPTFFKEDVIYKVYGSSPSSFKLVENASVGVKKGSGKSLAIAGETLFYHSSCGVMAFGGGQPKIISEPLGSVKYKNAVAGSDGVRYYMSAVSESDKDAHLLVYNTEKKAWSRYDDLEVESFAFCTPVLYALSAQGDVWSMSEQSGLSFDGEDTVPFVCELGDFTYREPNRKCMSKLQIRLEAEEDSVVRIYINYDSATDSHGRRIWEKVSEIGSCVKQSRYIPLVPRRCDHFRIKFEGEGEWTLYSLAKEFYTGSAV